MHCVVNLVTYSVEPQHPVAQLVEQLRYNPEGRGLDSQWCHCFRSHCDPGVDSVSNRNGTRNISWGVKAAGA